ncbi:MAG: synthase subunit gamma [Firmicutes bacterium]|nr:synthase subunit gamma [Bacillota bacterium]
MAGMKEIRTRIKSVESTLKITNAMYLISSASLRKMRKQLHAVEPYFSKIAFTISDILQHSPSIDHPFFSPDRRKNVTKDASEAPKVAYVVITGDKGLAGSYNHNVLRLLEQQLADQSQPCVFPIGHMGRGFCTSHGLAIDPEFFFTAQDPNLHRARSISRHLLSLYLQGDVDEIHLIYTRMISPLVLQPTLQKLLPLEKTLFPYTPRCEERFPRTVEYVPSEHEVLDQLVPSYLTGMIFGALVESYCSEQSARMMAMDASTKNAKDMLKSLSLSYNRARQSAITQEITEVVGGAKAGRF